MGSRLIFKDAKVKASSWYKIDAHNMAVGRLATHIATLLLGKHKPVYNPSLDCGDNVLVTNARQAQFTGKKWRQKHYRWHTGYPGGLKVYPASRMRDEHPERVLWKAVYGMLPKNRLRRIRMQRLKIFPDAVNPHESHVAVTPPHLAYERRIDNSLKVETFNKTPGVVVEFEPTDDGFNIHTTEHRPNNMEIPKNSKDKKSSGFFRKGDKPEAVVNDIETIPLFAPLKHLHGKKKK